jgi:hypothetical protein
MLFGEERWGGAGMNIPLHNVSLPSAAPPSCSCRPSVKHRTARPLHVSLRKSECYTYVIYEKTFSHVRQSSKQLWRWNFLVSGMSYIILRSLVGRTIRSLDRACSSETLLFPIKAIFLVPYTFLPLPCIQSILTAPAENFIRWYKQEQEVDEACETQGTYEKHKRWFSLKISRKDITLQTPACTRGIF